jgi:hypothetical protein
LAADPDGRRTTICFVTPQEGTVWDISYFGLDERSQLRTATIALENVRRRLLGIPV